MAVCICRGDFLGTEESYKSKHLIYTVTVKKLHNEQAAMQLAIPIQKATADNKYTVVPKGEGNIDKTEAVDVWTTNTTYKVVLWHIKTLHLMF